MSVHCRAQLSTMSLDRDGTMRPLLDTSFGFMLFCFDESLRCCIFHFCEWHIRWRNSDEAVLSVSGVDLRNQLDSRDVSVEVNDLIPPVFADWLDTHAIELQKKQCCRHRSASVPKAVLCLAVCPLSVCWVLVAVLFGGLVVFCSVSLVLSSWPVTQLYIAQDDLCNLCTHGVSTRAKKNSLQEVLEDEA